MTAKEKIIEFMKWKQARIQEVCGEAIPYFIEEDETAINAWSDENCENVWCTIKEKTLTGLIWDAPICPFCVNFSDSFLDLQCDVCTYAKHHGKCSTSNTENTYGHILKGNKRKHHSVCAIFDCIKIQEKIKELDAKADK